MQKGSQNEVKSMPERIQNQCKKCYQHRRGNLWKNMKNEEGKTMNFGAERHTVIQIQGSRGLVTERSLHQNSEENQ